MRTPMLPPVFGEIEWTRTGDTLHVVEILGSTALASVLAGQWRVMVVDDLAAIRACEWAETGEEHVVRIVETELQREWNAYKRGQKESR